MPNHPIHAGLLAAAVILAGPVQLAQAAFFFEGLKPFEQPHRCNDPFATDKDDCKKHNRKIYIPDRDTSGDGQGVRTRTREDIEK